MHKYLSKRKSPGCKSVNIFIILVLLNQWFLTFTNTLNPYMVFQAFVEPHFCPI